MGTPVTWVPGAGHLAGKMLPTVPALGVLPSLVQLAGGGGAGRGKPPSLWTSVSSDSDGA